MHRVGVFCSASLRMTPPPPGPAVLCSAELSAFLLQLPTWTLFLAMCAAGIGGTFQYGFNVSVINAPTEVSSPDVASRVSLLPQWMVGVGRGNVSHSRVLWKVGKDPEHTICRTLFPGRYPALQAKQRLGLFPAPFHRDWLAGKSQGGLLPWGGGGRPVLHSLSVTHLSKKQESVLQPGFPSPSSPGVGLPGWPKAVNPSPWLRPQGCQCHRLGELARPYCC